MARSVCERHLGLAAPEQELDRRRGRELRRAAEAAVAGVVHPAQPLHGLVEHARVHRLLRRLQRRCTGEPLGHAVAARSDLGRLPVPPLGHGQEDVAPAGHSVALLGREVGARVEGHLLGGQEHVERPAAAAGHRLAGLHVDRVEVRALLAVELHAHEALVHQRGGPRVLEGLALHHVAPVAGRVADREHDRHLRARPPRPAPPRPTGTSPRGCPCAGGGRARSLGRAGWPSL